MFAVSHVICQKDTTQTSCANLTIVIFSQKFFWGIGKMYALLLMLLMPIDLMAQNQKDFSLLVEQYRQEMVKSITLLCAHDYEKDPFKLGWQKMKERMDMIEDGYKARDLLNHFVGRGGRYNVSSMGVTTSAVAYHGPMVTLKLIDSSRKEKLIKKTAEKMYDYLYKKAIPIDKMSVDAMEVFKIHKVERNQWDRTVVYANKREMFELTSEGQLCLKTEKRCELTTVVGLGSTAFQLEINEYGYSLLLSDVEITVWIK